MFFLFRWADIQPVNIKNKVLTLFIASFSYFFVPMAYRGHSIFCISIKYLQFLALPMLMVPSWFLQVFWLNHFHSFIWTLYTKDIGIRLFYNHTVSLMLFGFCFLTGDIILNRISVSRLWHFGFYYFLSFHSHSWVVCENFSVVKGSADEDKFHKL